MKTITLFITLIIGLSITATSYAQKSIKANGNIIKKEVVIESINMISLDGAFDAEVTIGDQTSLTIESDSNVLPFIEISTRGGILTAKLTKNVKNLNQLKLYITTPELTRVSGSGASDIIVKEVTGELLKVEGSGACSLTIYAKVRQLRADISGASVVRLIGSSDYFAAEVSGAGDLKANSFIVTKADVKVSGAGDANVNVLETLNANTSGAGSISNSSGTSASNSSQVRIGNERTRVDVVSYYDGDTVNVSIGELGITVIDNDTAKVRVGRYQMSVSDNGNVNFKRIPRKKFNGHWGGVGIGINGYVTSDFNMDFAPEDRYLDLDMVKSSSVHINLYEQNFGLSRNQKFGLLTGIGFEWHNYRFDKNVQLMPNQNEIIGYYIDGATTRKSKLLVSHLVVPLIFEFQTQSGNCKKCAHIGLGVIGGVRLGSHTKIYYESQNVDYNLLDHTGAIVGTDNSPSQSKIKNRSDYNLNPFKADATVRIGWGIINLWTNYSLTTLFKENQGPELYPWSAGITLIGW